MEVPPLVSRPSPSRAVEAPPAAPQPSPFFCAIQKLKTLPDCGSATARCPSEPGAIAVSAGIGTSLTVGPVLAGVDGEARGVLGDLLRADEGDAEVADVGDVFTTGRKILDHRRRVGIEDGIGDDRVPQPVGLLEVRTGGPGRARVGRRSGHTGKCGEGGQGGQQRTRRAAAPARGGRPAGGCFGGRGSGRRGRFRRAVGRGCHGNCGRYRRGRPALRVVAAALVVVVVTRAGSVSAVVPAVVPAVVAVRWLWSSVRLGRLRALRRVPRRCRRRRARRQRRVRRRQRVRRPRRGCSRRPGGRGVWARAARSVRPVLLQGRVVREPVQRVWVQRASGARGSELSRSELRTSELRRRSRESELQVDMQIGCGIGAPRLGSGRSSGRDRRCCRHDRRISDRRICRGCRSGRCAGCERGCGRRAGHHRGPEEGESGGDGHGPQPMCRCAGHGVPPWSVVLLGALLQMRRMRTESPEGRQRLTG